jgi:hypothetical protein
MNDLLEQRRKEILNKWTHGVLDTYPAESTPFLKDEDDRFRNPVGYTIEKGLERIYGGLVAESFDVGVKEAIEDIIRMRAVQQFSPSEAVGFMIPLKGIIRGAVEVTRKASVADSSEFGALLTRTEREIDRMTMFAVDCYVKCREAIFQVRVREASAGGMMGASIARRRVR